MATILEALQNARINLKHLSAANVMIGYEQLNNAVTLLEKEYSIYTDVEELLDKYDSVEVVPHQHIHKTTL